MFAAVILLAGAFVFWLGWSTYREEKQFFATANIVPGTVVAIKEVVTRTRSEREYDTFPEIRIETSEGPKRFLARHCVHTNGFQLGDEVSVFLSPRFPGVAQLSLQKHWLTRLLMVLGSIAMIVGLVQLPGAVDAIMDAGMPLLAAMIGAIVFAMRFRDTLFLLFRGQKLTPNLEPVSEDKPAAS